MTDQLALNCPGLFNTSRSAYGSHELAGSKCRITDNLSLLQSKLVWLP